MITLVVSLIFISNNFAASLGLPAIGDENATLQEFREDELELQPREPFTFTFVGTFFLIRLIGRLLLRGMNNNYNHNNSHPAPLYPGAVPQSALLYPGAAVPVPGNVTFKQAFDIFLWNKYNSWQKKLGVNPNNFVPLPPYLVPSKKANIPVNPHMPLGRYMSNWEAIKFSLWTLLENKKEKKRLNVQYYTPPGSSQSPRPQKSK